MSRREFITLLSGAALAWPLVARAQQPAMPVVGLLWFGSLDTSVLQLAAFRKGLNEIGFVEGRDVAIEYRWAEGRYDRMPELAADLIRRRVAVIAAPGSPATVVRAVKAATSAIPIVFGVGDDPVKFGLVASLNRPGGNATGINFFTAELVAKRLALLHELVPGASRVAVLVNPADPARVESVLGDVETAVSATALQIQVLKASTSAGFAEPIAERVIGERRAAHRLQERHLSRGHGREHRRKLGMDRRASSRRSCVASRAARRP